MVDRIEDRDWERLDRGREVEKLTTQTEIEDWLFTRWSIDEKGNRVKVDIRKDHTRGEWKDHAGGHWRIRNVKGTRTSGIEKLVGEIYRPLEVQLKIEDASSISALPEKTEIDEVRIPSRANKLKDEMQIKGEGILEQEIISLNKIPTIQSRIRIAKKKIDVEKLTKVRDDQIRGLILESVRKASSDRVIFEELSPSVLRSPISPSGVTITTESARRIREKVLNNQSITESDIEW